MEQIPGIPGSIPNLALYPQESVTRRLSPGEWQSCLDSWLVSIDVRLRLQSNHFSKFSFSQPASGVPFLISYMQRHESSRSPFVPGSKEFRLHHGCYLLLKRLLLTTEVPYGCSPSDLFDLLGCASLAFSSVRDWKKTLKHVCEKSQKQFKSAVGFAISQVSAESLDTVDVSRYFECISALVKALPEVAAFIMAGADYLETLIAVYNLGDSRLQKLSTANIYYCLKNLILTSNKQTSLLLDNLYHLKSEGDRMQKSSSSTSTLLSNLVCSTPFLKHLRSNTAVANNERGRSLIQALTTYRQQTLHLHPPPPRPRRQIVKGKGKADVNEEMHMHKAGQISQVHELFPDLSNGYILRLLAHFSDDVEAVVAALLEPGSLPSDLQNQTSDDQDLVPDDTVLDLAPRSTPPLLPQRKNVFDNDDFDQLRISSSQVRRGKKDLAKDLSSVADEHVRSKAAILAALAAFDSDDDERDDTYDVADVGGAVDNTMDTDDRFNPDKFEEILFGAWKDSPELFARDSKTRMSNVRQQLKRDTGMGDEQIEGWAIMLRKDPKMEGRLQQKYSMDRNFRGNQKVLDSTRWRGNPSDTESHDEADSAAETSGDGRRVGQAGIRGPRTFGRGRGGSRGGGGAGTSGPADSAATQAARKRKEQGRGRGGANHNRRDGRAKKIGRGMGPLPG